MTIPRTCAAKSRATGFTLVEVLVAMALMVLIVPVVVQGLHLAALAGEVSQRKAQAMRIAEKVLNETIVTGQWNQGAQGGNEQAGAILYKWTVKNESWNTVASAIAVNTYNGINQTVVNANTLHQLTVDVSFPAQGQTYAVHLSTLIDSTQQPATMATPPAQ